MGWFTCHHISPSPRHPISPLYLRGARRSRRIARCLRRSASSTTARAVRLPELIQFGPPLFDFASNNSSLAAEMPRCRMLAHARPPPLTIPSRGVLGHPASIKSWRTPFESVNKQPTIVELPMRNLWVSCVAICRLAPRRFASPARVVKVETSHSIPALRKRSLEFLNVRYSASSDLPAKRARCSASASANAHASSSSLTEGLQNVRYALACRAKGNFEPQMTRIVRIETHLRQRD